MFSRWLRSGIRTQITIMVLIGAVLTTAVTLLIADASIQGYAIQQANAQQRSNLNVALLVLNKQFHSSVSIGPDNTMVYAS
jgi:H+/Cl- antiporter ClcA